MTAVDVSGEAKAEQAAARSELVAHVTERMNAAADPDAALRALTSALVPTVADVAAVYIIADANLNSGARTGTAPVALTMSDELLARVGPPPPSPTRSGPSPWDEALAAGQVVLIPLGGTPDPDVASDAATSEWMSRAEAHNIAVIPLVVAGGLAGALVLLSAGPRTPYTDADSQFLEALAARAGAAVAHLRAYQQQRGTALELQQALLPSSPPALPGLEVVARYLAGSEDVEVGGDWWDVHHLGAGRVGIGVGDVSGRGIPAAILMGQARSGMRAAAHADLPPGDILTILDAQVTDLVRIRDGGGGPPLPAKFATAAYAVIEPFDETLRIANAGHLPFLVRHRDGRVEQVAAPPGPPLGLGVGGYDELVVPFAAGSLLVAFTDGLVESRIIEVDKGIAWLAADLASADADVDLNELADSLLTRADGTDDTALVLLRLAPTSVPPGRLERKLTSLDDVPLARRAVTELTAQHVPALTDAAAQVCAELLANGIRHAGPPVYLRALATAERLILEVSDTSASRPRQRAATRDDEGGRGLPLVSAFADSWGSRITRHGKSTWAEFHVTTTKPAANPQPLRGLGSHARR
jgi:anti-sigma regulatory factor (Ser/Thr protein kinase)